jgi:metallophosphoesterase superfamily enzyme
MTRIHSELGHRHPVVRISERDAGRFRKDDALRGRETAESGW